MYIFIFFLATSTRMGHFSRIGPNIDQLNYRIVDFNVFKISAV